MMRQLRQNLAEFILEDLLRIVVLAKYFSTVKGRLHTSWQKSTPRSAQTSGIRYSQLAKHVEL